MTLHLSQVSFFDPVLQELRHHGYQVDDLLKQSNLHKFDLSDPEHYVPARYVYDFLDAACYKLGSPDILNDFAQAIKLTSLEQWGEMIAYAPDLLCALQLADQYGSVVNTHERTGYCIRGNRTTYWQKFVDSPDQPGRDQADHIDLALAINGFQLAAGKDWAPLEIHLQTQTEPNLDVLLPPGSNTRVLLGQPATAVVFETSLISAPMLCRENEIGETPNFFQNDGLTASLEAILNSLSPKNTINLELISEIMDVAPRTLQRRLSGEDKTLSGIVDQWRMKTSIHLLENTNLMVKEISERVGYSDDSNFERAFRRWTQTTPKRFRQSLDS